MPQAARTMVPVSGRIEDDLYAWFVSLQYEGAVTNSDKLREALKELRSQHAGMTDTMTAQAWLHKLSLPLRQALAAVERDEMRNSEILTLMLDHVSALAALLVSGRPQSVEEARQLEEQMVRRGFAMTEALLRQAVTPSAAAFDPKVVRRHCSGAVELAQFIKQGEQHG